LLWHNERWSDKALKRRSDKTFIRLSVCSFSRLYVNYIRKCHICQILSLFSFLVDLLHYMSIFMS
jgi:hypothetical protein